MSHSKKKKDLLLNTPLNQLGLGKEFNRYFIRETEPVLTLQEFFSKNHTLITNKESFEGLGFIKESIQWGRLKEFLLQKGFTHRDWIMLLPETGTPKRFDLKLLSKDQIKEIPFYKVVDIKPNCMPYSKLGDFFLGDNFVIKSTDQNDAQKKFNSIPVSKLLSLTYKQANAIVKGKEKHHYMDNGEESSFRKSLVAMQNKLKDFGFTEKDGPFMRDYFGKKTYHYQMIDHMVRNLGFSKKKALKIINLAKSAEIIE